MVPKGDVDITYDPDRVDYIAYKAHVILGTEWLFKGGIPAVYSDILALLWFGGFIFHTMVHGCRVLFIYIYPCKKTSPNGTGCRAFL